MTKAKSKSTTETAAGDARPAWYARLWRWHLISGLLLAPTLLVLGVTGIIYLFKPQVEPVLYRHWLEVPAQAASASFEVQLKAAKAEVPGASLKQLIPSTGPGKSSLFSLREKDGTPWVVYVDPHSGNAVGKQREDRTLMQLAHDLHGELLIGDTGAWIMEFTAGWTLVLAICGLYLFWPKSWKEPGGALYPRAGLKGRAWWKDWHSVPGFWFSGLIFIFLLTGIPWTGYSGKLVGKFGESIGQGSPPGFGGSPFKVDPLGRPAVPLDRYVQVLHERVGQVPARIIPPKKADGAAVIVWKSPKPQDRAYIHVDPYSGEVIKDFRWKDFGWVGGAVAMGVALHEGTWFGAWNQLLNTLVASAVILLALSGVWMWWRRRPASGGLALPAGREPMPPSFKLLLVLAGLLVPPVGLSLLLIAGLEFWWESRSPQS